MPYIKFFSFVIFFYSCIPGRGIHFRIGQTKQFNQSNFVKEKDSLYLFDPIIIINGESNTPYHKVITTRNYYTKKFHTAIDQYFTENNIQHQFVIGDFTDYKKVQNVVNLFNSVKMENYTFDSLPLRKGFILPKNKFGLLIAHELDFQSDFSPFDMASEPINRNFYNPSVFEKIVTIKTYAMMIQNKEIVYYSSNEVDFDNFKTLHNNRRALKVYHRILKNLVR